MTTIPTSIDVTAPCPTCDGAGYHFREPPRSNVVVLHPAQAVTARQRWLARLRLFRCKECGRWGREHRFYSATCCLECWRWARALLVRHGFAVVGCAVMAELSIYEAITALREDLADYAPYVTDCECPRCRLYRDTAAAEQRAKQLHDLAAQAEEEPEEA